MNAYPSFEPLGIQETYFSAPMNTLNGTQLSIFVLVRRVWPIIFNEGLVE